MIKLHYKLSMKNIEFSKKAQEFYSKKISQFQKP